MKENVIKKIVQPKSKFENNDQIILRDYLALERTKLANERTLMSYVRASIYLVLAGIAFLRLQDFQGIKWLGIVTIIISVLVFFMGLVRYFRFRARLRKYYPETEKIEK